MARRTKPIAAIAAMATLGTILLLASVVRWAGSRPRVLPTTYDSAAVAFSPNGSLLATGHEVPVQNKAQGWGYMSGALEVRQMPGGSLRNAVPFTERTVRAQDSSKAIGAAGWMTFSPDGSLLLVSNHNNDSVAVLDVASGRWLFVRKGQWRPARRIYRPVGFSNEGKHVLYLLLVPDKMDDRSEDRREKVVHEASLVTCEARTGKVVAQHAHVLGPGEWPMRLVLLPDGQGVACTTRIGNDRGGSTDRGKVLLIDVGTGRRKQVTALDYLPVELACAPDGRRLAILDAEGTAHFFDVNLSERARSAGRSIGSLRTRGAPGGHWLAFSPDGRWLAGVSRKSIALWDTQQHKGGAARFIERRGKWAWAEDLAFSADGKMLAVADGEKSVALWPVAEPGK